MIDDLDKINELTKNVRLSTEEKAAMRGVILRSVRNNEEARPIMQESSFFSRLTFHLNPLAVGAYAAILLSVGLGSAASFAAQSALPGDTLYAVKTGINERTREVLAFSAESKAEVEAEISEARLQEAAKLVQENRFTDENRENIEMNFERHAGKVQARIEEMQEKGMAEAAADISAKFETSLEAHEQILEKLDGEEMVKFLPKVKARKNAAFARRMEIEAKIGIMAAARASSTASTTLQSVPGKESGDEGENDAEPDKKQIDREEDSSGKKSLFENIRSRLGL